MNKLSFTGRLAADAEVRFTPARDPICGFRVASDVGFGDKKTTNWFSCQIWGKRGEALAPYLVKGQQVTVFGSLTLREWQGKDGSKQLSPDVRVDEIELQGGKREGDAAVANRHQAAKRPEQQQKPAPSFSDLDDDVPF